MSPQPVAKSKRHLTKIYALWQNIARTLFILIFSHPPAYCDANNDDVPRNKINAQMVFPFFLSS